MISLCLIARDEEQMLPGCLASIRGAVDEIVVVDTGSSDRTLEIARTAGAVVAERPWTGFADARNAAFDLATGDWILVLDADERLAAGGGRALRRHARKGTEPLAMLRLHNATTTDAREAEVLAGRARQGNPTWLPRFFRREPGLRYEGLVHETVERWHSGHGFATARLDGDIVHLGGAASVRDARGKDDRNLALLERWCRTEEESIVPYGYLAVELLARGKSAEGWEAAERGWSLLDRQPATRNMSRLATARGLLALERAEAPLALASVNRAEAHDGPSPDLHLVRARAHEALALAASASSVGRARALAAAEASLLACLALDGVPVDRQVLTGATRWLGWTRLGAVQLAIGRPGPAAASFERALSSSPDYLEALLGRLEARLAQGDAAGALGGVEPLLGRAPDGWALAAFAADALGSRPDAEGFLAQAFAARGRWVSAERRARAEERRRVGDAVRAPSVESPEPRATASSAEPAPSPGGARSPPDTLVNGAGAQATTAGSTRADEAESGPTRCVPEPAGAQRWAVTVISPPGYVHSAAFAEVAETLAHGLSALGHEVVLTTDPGLPGRRHLVLGANLLPHTRQRLAKGSILYNLEQIEAGSPWLGPTLLDLYRRQPVWDYSHANADALVRLGLPRPMVVPIGYAPCLTRIAPRVALEEEDIDVLFYGSLNPRRLAVLDALANRGVRVHRAFGVYGAARDALVARSKLVLNLHFCEAKVFEVVRVSYLLANRRTVVSERGANRAEEAAFEDGVAFAPYDGLVERCLELLAAPEERRRLAEAGFRLMTARPVEGYLREVVGEAGAGRDRVDLVPRLS